MHKVRALFVALVLVVAVTVTLPALAGPQNGEVNHFGHQGQTYHPCAGELPGTLLDEVLANLRVLIRTWLPASLRLPDGE